MRRDWQDDSELSPHEIELLDELDFEPGAPAPDVQPVLQPRQQIARALAAVLLVFGMIGMVGFMATSVPMAVASVVVAGVAGLWLGRSYRTTG